MTQNHKKEEIKIDTLNNLKIGECAIVLENNAFENIKRRLLDIGLIKNTRIQCVLKSPFGDPSAYMIRGALIAIRNEDAQNIIIEKYNNGADYIEKQN